MIPTLTKISTLAESILQELNTDTSAQDKLDYTCKTLQTIQDTLKNLSAKKYYVRICQNHIGELDIENMQIYTEDDIREEFVAIDYVDEDDIDSMSIEDLQEIAMNNNEYIEEIEIIQSI